MQNRKATRRIPQIRASLGVKLIAVALLVVVVIFGLSAYQGGQSIRQNLRNDAQSALEQISSVLQSELDGDQAAATMVALSIASRSDIQQLTADSNRQGLADILTPLFGQLNDQYKVVHLNIINDQGLVILRVNEPNNFGDYVFYNFVVSNTLETRRPTSGLEVDISGLSMRGAAPMFRDGRLIGLVEVGLWPGFCQSDETKNRGRFHNLVLQAFDRAFWGSNWQRRSSGAKRKFHLLCWHPDRRFQSIGRRF